MKKVLWFTLGLFLTISIIVLGIVFYFWINWNKNSDEYLKETEVYFNSLNRVVYKKAIKYQFIGSVDSFIHTMSPIKIYDRNSKLIGSIDINNKIILPINKMNNNFLTALICIEDKNFFKHRGISFQGILRAFISNLKSMKIVEGGSTITQQLSKLLFSNQERTIKRKFNELFTSLSMERRYTKGDILFMYTNLIYFGYNIYGIGQAAKAYFNKNASELSLEEAALLVALIPNPSLYNPYKRTKNAKKKHLSVLLKLSQEGYFSKETALSVFNNFWEKPTLLPQVNLNLEKEDKNMAPYIIEEVRRFLIKEYGDNFNQRLQGSNIYTSIDLDLQIYGQRYLSKQIKNIRSQTALGPVNRKSVESVYLVSNPKTGEILSFMGGSEYNKSNQFNRAFQAKRQVGSTIKPFLYLVGLDLKEITPYTVFEDVPIQVQIGRKKYWNVNNYGHTYRGSLNVIDALKRSSNVVAVQAVNKIGLENLSRYFQNALNFSYLDAQKFFPNYQYSIVLGAIELTPLQLNQLYQVVANDGVVMSLFFIDKIEDIKGKIVYEHIMEPKKIVSKEATFLLKGILKQVMGPGGSGSIVQRTYEFKEDIGGKSGTTQNNRDVWFSGFTSSLLTTVWIGQDHNKSLGRNFVGGRQAGTIFGSIMKFALKSYPASSFKADNSYDFTKSSVDILTGLSPTRDSLFTTTGLFINGTEPTGTKHMSKEEQVNLSLKKKILSNTDAKKILGHQQAESVGVIAAEAVMKNEKEKALKNEIQDDEEQAAQEDLP